MQRPVALPCRRRLRGLEGEAAFAHRQPLLQVSFRTLRESGTECPATAWMSPAWTASLRELREQAVLAGQHVLSARPVAPLACATAGRSGCRPSRTAKRPCQSRPPGPTANSSYGQREMPASAELRGEAPTAGPRGRELPLIALLQKRQAFPEEQPVVYLRKPELFSWRFLCGPAHSERSAPEVEHPLALEKPVLAALARPTPADAAGNDPAEKTSENPLANTPPRNYSPLTLICAAGRGKAKESNRRLFPE
jgi:hypothetical protein